MAKYRVIEVDCYTSQSRSKSTKFVVQKAYNFLFITFWFSVENAVFYEKESAISLANELFEMCNKPAKTVYTK